MTGPAPSRMDLRKIARAGEARARALKAADDRVDEVLAELERAGELANIALAAKVSGIGRATIHRRRRARAAGVSAATPALQESADPSTT